MRVIRFATAIALSLFVSAAGAGTCTWTGGAGAGAPEWNVGSNWSCTSGTVPEAADDIVVFPATGVSQRGTENYTITAVDSIGQTVSASGTITITAGGDFTWTGSIDGDWANAGNWSPASIPTSGAILRFPDSALTKTVVNAPGGIFDYIELSDGYSVSGPGIFSLTNTHAIRFNSSSTATTMTAWDTPLRLSAANALVTALGTGTGRPTLKLGQTSIGLDFATNLRFDLGMNTATDNGFVTVIPFIKQLAQAGNVSYFAVSGATQHDVVLATPTNYTGDTLITGPLLRAVVRDAAGLGQTVGNSVTRVTDATLQIENLVTGATMSFSNTEQLVMRNVNRPSDATFKAINDGGTVIWNGPISAPTAFANLDSNSGQLTIAGVISGIAQLRVGAGTGPSGLGVVRLDAVNTYTGGTEINNQSDLESGVAQAVPNGIVTLVGTTARWLLNGFNHSIATLSNGPGDVVLNGATLSFGANVATFSGNIIGATGSVVMTGGTLEFSGTCDAANWVLRGGTLGLQGAANIASLQMDGGTLRPQVGSSPVIGMLRSFSAASTGVIDLGNENISTTSTSLNSPVQLRITIDSTNSGQLTATGALDLGTTASILLNELTPLAIGATIQLARGNFALFGVASNLAPNSITVVGGNNYKVLYSENVLELKRLGTLSPIVTVNSVLDTGTGPTECTLRQAVASISTNAAPANTSCLNGAPGATVNFSAAVSGVINLTEGIGIDAAMIIQGPGARVLRIDGNGGQIFVVDDGLPARVSVQINDLSLVNGRAAQGAAMANSETLSVQRSYFENNVADGLGTPSLGGAIANLDGLLLVSASTFVSNAANTSDQFEPALGGAIFSVDGSIEVVNSTFSGNSVNATMAEARGGAIFTENVGAIIRHCNFVNNDAIGTGIATGGGISTFNSGVAINHSVFVDNASTTGPADADIANAGTASFSLIASASATLSQVSPITGSPLLLALANNGGPVDTFAFERESVLKDAGGATPGNAPALDARGRPRVSNALIDIGAFEQNLSITSTLPDGVLNAPYSQILTATGAGGPFTFLTQLTAGQQVPPGLTLSSAGTVAGMPSQVGTFTFRLKAFNAAGDVIYATYSLTISNAPPVATTSTLTATLPTIAFTPGVSYAVNATISSASAVPVGLVTIFARRLDDPLQTLSCTPTVTPGTNAILASCSLSPNTPGVWVTTVNFEGMPPFQSSQVTANAIVTANLQTLAPSQSATETVVGESFQVITSIVPAQRGLPMWPIPRGTVTVQQIPANVSSSGSVLSGSATVNLISRSAVNKALFVTYQDNLDGVYNTQTVLIPHSTLRAPTSVSASLVSSSGNAGQSVQVNYTLGVVPPGGIPPGSAGPSGQIEIFDGVDRAQCALSGTSGSCSFTPSTLGLRSIVARYNGDSDYAFADSAPMPYTVGQGGGQVDLSVTIGNGVRSISGTSISYTVLIRNLSSVGVGGANVLNALPLGAASQSFTCTATAGSNCGSASTGTGPLNQFIDLAGNGAVSFRTTLTLDLAATLITNAVSVAAPSGFTDSNPNNNAATDTDPIGVFGSGFEDDLGE